MLGAVPRGGGDTDTSGSRFSVVLQQTAERQVASPFDTLAAILLLENTAEAGKNEQLHSVLSGPCTAVDLTSWPTHLVRRSLAIDQWS